MNNVIYNEYAMTLEERLTSDKCYWRFVLRQPYRFLLYVLAGISMLAFGTVLYQEGFAVWPALGFFVVFYLTFLTRFFHKARLKKLFLTQPERNKLIRYEITAESIKVFVEGVATSEFIWNCITKMVSVHEGILLFPNEVTFHWVPKHGFSNIQDIDMVVEWGKSHVREFREIG